MQEIILAVSHAGWTSANLIRAIFIIFYAVFITVIIIRCKIKTKQEEARLEKLFYEDRQRRFEKQLKRSYIKRRKDHPLTTIFKNEMPKGTRPSYLGISKSNF